MKIKGLRWWIIGLIGLATIINYIDRTAINVLWPYIYPNFGISDANSKDALKLLTTFFLVAYALGQTLTGKMMDSIGTRLGFTASILGWSISIALHSIARTISSFNILRFFLGISEAGNWPGAAKSNAEWFPAKERGIAQGIFGAGASFGSVVSLPIIAMVYHAYGWKNTFLGIGMLGFLWIIPWLIVNRNTPDKHPWITEKEREHILKGTVLQTVSKGEVYSWRQLLKFRDTWGMILARFFIDPIWWMFVTWLPTFLKDEYQFELKDVGAAGWVPYLFAAIGGVLGGVYSGWLIKRGKTPATARKWAISLGSIVMLLSLGAIAFELDQLRSHVAITLALISAALFGFQFLINNLQTLPSDYFNGKNVGTVAGMGGTFAVAGTVVVTWLVPVITKQSYTMFFLLGALLVPAAWLCLKLTRSTKSITAI